MVIIPLPTIDSMGGANTHSSIKTSFELWWWWWYYSKLLKVCGKHFALSVSWKCNKFLRFKKYIQKKSPQQELEDRRRWDKLLEFHKWIKLEPFIFYINQDVIFRPRIPISFRTALKLDLLLSGSFCFSKRLEVQMHFIWHNWISVKFNLLPLNHSLFKGENLGHSEASILHSSEKEVSN